MAEFLLEIGTEEIPARMLRKAEKDLKEAIEKLLTESRLTFEPLEAHGAPRQMTVWSRRIDTAQDDREETIMGPPVRIAYDGDGNATRALQGFLKKNPGLSEGDLFRVEQKKGEVVAGKLAVKGRRTIDILAEALPGILEKMHFPKNMRWGDNPTRFVRPVRNLLALLDGDIIPFEFAGVVADDHSFGHRFEGADTFTVTGIDEYVQEKKNEGILVRHEDRIAEIRDQLEHRLSEIGGRLVEDDELLEEIADLVEIPFVVVGSFSSSFLEIPKEVLVTSLRDHQKSFCVQDENGSLMPYFLAIASVDHDEKGLIRKGNEWVLNARLWDADFFWKSDLKKDFDGLRERLKTLVFQTKIGSYHGKTERMAHLAGFMADQLKLDASARENLVYCASICKNDLVSELVFEFPELQGVTGGLLLNKRDKPENVWKAVYQHYLPVSMDGELPELREGALVSLADKLDTLVGCFAVGLIPTGAKDPYALRRATQGIVRILIEHELPFSLAALLQEAVTRYAAVLDTPADLTDKLLSFFQDRMRYYLKRKAFQHDLIEAILARDSDRVDQTLKRAEAVIRQQDKPGFRTLALNLKRMNNVITDELDKLGDTDVNLLADGSEKALYEAYQNVRAEIESAAAERNYNRAMDLMTELAGPVEAYFEHVLVNDKDDAVRLNRKAMLRQIGLTLGIVADISCLE